MRAALKAKIAIKRTLLKALERQKEKNIRLIRFTKTEIAELEDEYNSLVYVPQKIFSVADYRNQE